MMNNDQKIQACTDDAIQAVRLSQSLCRGDSRLKEKIAIAVRDLEARLVSGGPLAREFRNSFCGPPVVLELRLRNADDSPAVSKDPEVFLEHWRDRVQSSVPLDSAHVAAFAWGRLVLDECRHWLTPSWGPKAGVFEPGDINLEVYGMMIAGMPSLAEPGTLVARLRSECAAAIAAGDEGGTKAGRAARKEDRLKYIQAPDGPFVSLDGEPVPVASAVLAFVGAIIEAKGQFVAMAKHDVRTRDLEGLPARLAELIERKPGAGCRLRVEQLA